MTLALPALRLRRLREHPVLRRLIRETELTPDDLILPLFIKGNSGDKIPVPSMPGHYQIPLNKLAKEIREIVSSGISAVILFGVPDYKDSEGSDSFNKFGIVQRAIEIIRNTASDLLIISDNCFCEYTDHGHCGPIGKNGMPDNDRTLELLVKQVVSHAEAGTDVISPSGMIDGMVGAIRKGLDAANFSHIPILSYAVKYHSAFYGPFRFAAEGAPLAGDRSGHQMDPANSAEALREVELDIREGTDMLMVKPAHAYLDVIYRVKSNHPQIPLGAYHTSGEFCMIKAAAANGWIDEKRATVEILTGIKRAGADFIITYCAKEFAESF